MELPETVAERLEHMRVLSEADSRTEVIRRALGLCDFLLEQSNDGATVALNYEDGRPDKEVFII